MSLVGFARCLKHRHFLWKKKREAARQHSRDVMQVEWSRSHEYHYDRNDDRSAIYGVRLSRSSTMQVNHLDFDVVGDVSPSGPAPEILWAVWAGTNPMTPHKVRLWEQLQEVNSDLDCILVTPDNLQEFVDGDAPIHPAYEYLSAVHKSDYLRAYLMHHHGGAYADIKPGIRGFKEALIDPLNADEELWAMGPEALPHHTSPAVGPLGEVQERFVTHQLFPAAFACKPGSSFTAEWFAEVTRRMNYYADVLESHPAADPFGSNDDYPVPWVALCGQVMCPLCLKYTDHVKTIEDRRVMIWGDASEYR